MVEGKGGDESAEGGSVHDCGSMNCGFVVLLCTFSAIQWIIV